MRSLPFMLDDPKPGDDLEDPSDETELDEEDDEYEDEDEDEDEDEVEEVGEAKPELEATTDEDN